MKIEKILMPVIVMLAFTIVAGAAQSNETDDTEELIDDIEEYEGSIGPDNALYGLKIAFEELDETFTFDRAKKIGKQVDHARNRLSEAKAELKKDNQEGADKALERYRTKIEETDESILTIEGNDSGLLNAQKMIIKHQYVLEQLLLSHPDNPGLENAYNNSLVLEEKFELKTELKVKRFVTKDKKIVIKKLEKERSIEKIEVKAEIIGNSTQVKVEVEFLSNETEIDPIAEEILKRMKLSRENITDLIEIEVEDEIEDLEEKLEAEAEIEKGISEVEAEFKFPLNVTNETEIIDGTHEKLSALTIDDILNVLEVEVEKEKGKPEKDERTRVKAEVSGNGSDIKIEVRFETIETDQEEIAQAILEKLQMSKENISDLLEIEIEDEEDRQERLRAKASGKDGLTEVDAEYRFPLNVTNETEIVDGIHEKLSALTAAEILDVLEVKIKESKIEEKEKKREEKEIEKTEKEEERAEEKEERKNKMNEETEEKEGEDEE